MCVCVCVFACVFVCEGVGGGGGGRGWGEGQILKSQNVQTWNDAKGKKFLQT